MPGHMTTYFHGKPVDRLQVVNAFYMSGAGGASSASRVCEYLAPARHGNANMMDLIPHWELQFYGAVRNSWTKTTLRATTPRHLPVTLEPNHPQGLQRPAARFVALGPKPTQGLQRRVRWAAI